MSADTFTGQQTSKSPERASSTVPLWGVLLPLVATAVLMVIAAQQPDGRLHVWVLDVGQGDAIFLRTPAGHTALVDGGPGATPVLNGVDAHIPFWRREIDLVVLTHPHQDHMMAFVDALERYHVDQVVQTEFTATGGVQSAWVEALRVHPVPVHYARRGDTIVFDGEPDISLRVLSPSTPDALRERQGGDINNTSIVLKLAYGSTSILLEGDAQAEAEGEMDRVDRNELPAQVLKVGHHGSNTSSTPGFLADVQPRVAIISVGVGNDFGHPSQQTIESLQAIGAKVYRTDLNGTVEVIADKERLWVRSER